MTDHDSPVLHVLSAEAVEDVWVWVSGHGAGVRARVWQ